MTRSVSRHLSAIMMLATAGVSGCLVDDRRADHALPPAQASVPDAGSPLRRESAAETLGEGDPQPPPDPDGNVLEVAPAGSQRIAPPVR